MNQYRLIFSVIILFVVNICLHGQTVNLNAPLDIDPNVKIGKLDNGMTYYIRNNHKPEKRVYMWLAVKAGSCNENDDQQGLAHFNEHMAFNGTTHFKHNDLEDFLEKIGVKFGADLNAGTSFTETVYNLEIPSDKPELVDEGFLVLEDWSHNLTFDDKEIDKERGVIMEEWRLGLGADDRMMKKYIPVILKGSRYAERLPIGKTDIIEHCKHSTLKQFYYDWYRPDLFAVIIVGDIDVNIAEQKIKDHFTQLKNPENERKALDFDIPDNKDPLVSVCTDKEATGSMVQIFFKHNKEIQKTIGDYRKYLLYNLFTGMLNKRFEEITQKPESPFIYAYSYYGNFLAKSKDAYVLGSEAKENMIDKTVETMILENERVRQYGFTATELERLKADLLSQYENMEKEADKTESMNFMQEYVGNFLTYEPIPGIKNELKYVKDLLPGIKVDEINKLSKEMITDDNMCVVVTAPLKDGVKVPDEAQVLDIIKSAKSKEVTAYVDKVSSSPLVDVKPAGSKVISAKENKDFGYTELTFANGVKAILKPTDFKNDEIQFSGYSLGGTSLYPDKDIMSATFASTIIDQSGLGNMDLTGLKKKLSGKIVQVSPWIDVLKEGFEGSCAPKDFETLLQLTYLYFKEPRKDTTAFKAFISKMKNQIKFYSSSPQIYFVDTLQKIVTCNNPRTIAVPTMKQLDKIDLDVLYNIYKERFANAADFKFFLAGNFKIDEITPLLETYLGGLPAIQRKEAWKNVEPKFPQGVTDVTVRKGIEPLCIVSVIMKNKFDWTYRNTLIDDIMMGILKIKLRNNMREEKSSVYTLEAQGIQELYPEPTNTSTFAWGCSPKNANKMCKALFKEIKKMKKHGPSKVDIDKVKENLNREREVNDKKNEFWLERFNNLYFRGTELSSVDGYKSIINSITIEDIQKEAQRYLTDDHYVKVVLLPEDKKK